MMTLAEIIATNSKREQFFRRPHVRLGWRCRLGFHKWESMPVGRGLLVRGVTSRTGCGRCGMVKMRKAALGGGSRFWGWYPPSDLSLDFSQVLEKNGLGDTRGVR